MTEMHPGPDVLADLALAHLDEDRRDQVTHHFAGCQACRAEYATLADAVDHLLAAAPRVAPPPGFSRAALAAMGVGSPVPSAAAAVGQPATPTAVPRPPRAALPRRALALAVAAAFVLGVGGTAVVLQALREPAGTEQAASGAALLTGSGQRVGSVLAAYHDAAAVLVVTLTVGEPGTRYDCVLVTAAGERIVADSWVVGRGLGDTWVVEVPAGAEVAGMELVTVGGAVWAGARL